MKHGWIRWASCAILLAVFIAPQAGPAMAAGSPNRAVLLPKSIQGTSAPNASLGWNTLMSEGFEGIFPSGLWKVDDDDGATNGEYFWGSDDYKPHTGSRSAWLARSGANGLDPEFNNYPDYANSWMVYGPFDLSGYSDAELSFYYWLNSEYNCDFFYVGVSTDGTNFYGDNKSGDSVGWLSYNFALGGYSGETSVWIAFSFQSDEASNNKGVFVDNILLRAYESPTATPTRTNTPTATPTRTDTPPHPH